VSGALIVAALAAVALIAAILSFAAWYMLARRPSEPEREQEERFDSEDPVV
jgi:hypothetical protein